MNYSEIYRVYVYPIIIAFCSLLSFIVISWTGNPSAWIWGSMAIFFILPVFRRYKYFIKIYSLVVLSLIVFSGLILVYTYLYYPTYVSNYPYYSAIGYFPVVFDYFCLLLSSQMERIPTKGIINNFTIRISITENIMKYYELL